MAVETEDGRTFRRVPCIFLKVEDVPVFDLQALLRSEFQLGRAAEVELFHPRTGRARRCTLREAGLLAQIPSGDTADDAVTAEDIAELGLPAERLEFLLEAGAVVETGSAEDRWWRARRSLPWHPVSGLFHGTCLHEDHSEDGELRFDVEAASRDRQQRLDALVQNAGPPPPPWIEFEAGEDGTEAVPLPDAAPASGDLLRSLMERRTCRQFSRQELPLESLSTLMRYAFGATATVTLGTVEGREPHVVAHRTSPSGGSMHPIEAFPIVCNVESLRPGVYHYDSRRHVLQPLATAPETETRQLIDRLSEGQSFVSDAAVVVLLVARLGRNFWKYGARSRTYSVVLQDAGHLSQTLYLLATHLGLGAFYTGAVAGWVARQELGVDDARELPVGLFGCGLADPEAPRLFDIEPFRPGQDPAPGSVERRPIRRPIRQERPTDSLGESDDAVPGEPYFRGLRLTPEI